MTEVKCYCPKCKTKYVVSIDPDIARTALSITGALNFDGEMICACEACHPVAKLGAAFAEYQRKYTVQIEAAKNH